MTLRTQHWILVGCLLWLGQWAARTCQAGLTASEVVVVVNSGSKNSRTLANHYVKLRNIPAVNVIVLEDVPDRETITAETFREKILKPLLGQINQRGIANHIQCIAYSADFPTAIDITKDIAKLKEKPQFLTPVGSISGLTYLYELSAAGNPSYVLPEINFYARHALDRYFTNPGGAATEVAWQSIQKRIDRKQHDQAYKELLELVKLIPSQYPLRYLAAAEAALAREPDAAVKMLESAITGGWNSGKFLADDHRFDSLRKRDDFQLLEILLDADSGKHQPSEGFNSRALWAPNGVRLTTATQAQAFGSRYLLSIVLGVTRGAGNSLQEAIDCLTRAAKADFTHPDGSFYFSSTPDVRSETRKPMTADAISELKKLGYSAETISTPLPMRKKSVLGVQFGVSTYDWSKSFSELVPGAIADNLTSYGGVMTPSDQTKLSELIRAGAAGSCGTVTEPYALAFKFPSPFLYFHYAQGCSLVEAFYQSVTGPYQLLIVGDPLCQPFSNAPNQQIDTSLRMIQINQGVSFLPNLNGLKYADWLNLPEPPSQRKAAFAPAKIAVQVDGSSPRGGAIQRQVNVALDGVSLGYHEVQILLIADDPTNQRSLQTIPVWVGDPDLITLTLPQALQQPAAIDSTNTISLQAGSLTASVKLPSGCIEVSIFHQAETVASVNSPTDSKTELAVDIARLGMGPVRLQARAKLADETTIASQPVWIEVTP